MVSLSMKSIFSTVILLLASPVVVCVDSEKQQDPMETLQEFQARMASSIQGLLAQQNQTDALWFGISDPFYGRVYWTFGFANKGSSTPATANDHFQIGSISKSFGATVILLLAERGDLSLVDTIANLAPELTAQFPMYADFTVADLLGMQALVPDFLDDPTGLVRNLTADPTLRFSIPEMIQASLRSGQVEVCPQGEECAFYSTTNFLVLEYIAEKITDTPMPQLIADLITKPLDIGDTVEPKRDSDGVLPDPTVTPYAGSKCVEEFQQRGTTVDPGADLTELSRAVSSFGIGGNMYSTIRNLVVWAQSGTGDSLLANNTVTDRHVYRTIPSTDRSYGMGQYQLEGNWYGHEGGTFGFGSQAYRNDCFNAAYAAAVNTCAYTDILDQLRVLYQAELEGRITDTGGSPTMSPPERETGDGGGGGSGSGGGSIAVSPEASDLPTAAPVGGPSLGATLCYAACIAVNLVATVLTLL